MKVAKWGNSLAIRLPAVVADVLELSEGDDVEVTVVGERKFEVARAKDRKALLARFEKFRGMMPKDFKFDRDEANER